MKKYYELDDEYRKRAEEMVSKMTIEEVASQLKYDAPSIERLGISSYNWWNEGLHGLARGGTATVFAQAIALAATFDEDLIGRVADIVSTEARAKYNEYSKLEDRDIYKGLTIWSPNINIFRDPRWGRGQETYGEDPYLTATMGISFIGGLQGDGEHLKVSACAKHLAVHSGPEKYRHEFDAVVSKKDLNETYLYAFKRSVKDGHVESVMGAYNRVNGEPCCGSKTLLKDILRNQWGFKGHVVSDCWAIQDFHVHHMVTKTASESAALAMNNGCDLNCGSVYLRLLEALDEGRITEDSLRVAAIRLFATRYKLGMFDEYTEYDNLGLLNVGDEHAKKVSYESSLKSQVLLKNNGILPLKSGKYDTIGVIGPTAASIEVLNGNYNGISDNYITNLSGIRKAAEEASCEKNANGSQIRILYSEGSHLYNDKVQGLAKANDRISEAVAVAQNSDVVIMCLGLDSTIEGEEGDAGNEFASGDKMDLYLPKCQRVLFEEVSKTGTPIILVVNAGSAMDVSKEACKSAAVIMSWYSGEFGGKALGDIIFGKAVPSGKLPVTFYYDGTLPDFMDYSMKGRTYKFVNSDVLYPFGYGLSYSKFKYVNMRLTNSKGIINVDNEGFSPFDINVEVDVKNVGDYDADEVVEVYVKAHVSENLHKSVNKKYVEKLKEDNQPRWVLAGFKRVSVPKGGVITTLISVSSDAFAVYTEDGDAVFLEGEYTLFVGGSQPDEKSCELTGEKPLYLTCSYSE